MVVAGILGWAAQSAAYTGPGTPLTYDVTQGTAPNQVRAVMTVQPVVHNGIYARFTLVVHLTKGATTGNVTLGVKRIDPANPGDANSDDVIFNCTTSSSAANGTPIQLTCDGEVSPGDISTFASILSGYTSDAQFYPYVSTGNASQAFNGRSSALSVPLGTEDGFEGTDPDYNDTSATPFDLGSPLTTQVLNTLTLRKHANEALLGWGSDFYRFTVPTGKASAEIAIDFWNAQCDLELYFYDSFGSMITASTSSSDHEQINIAVESSNSYIIGVEPGAGTCSSFYDLRLSLAAADIVSITAGPTGVPNPVGANGTVQLNVSASDSLGHGINYTWNNTCSAGQPGTFSNRFIANPIWTAPGNATSQTCNIRVTVDDGLGNSATSNGQNGNPPQLVISIGTSTGTITVTSGPSGTPDPVTPPATVSTTVTATHSNGLPLTYFWSAVCPTLGGNGSFANANVQSAVWTPPANVTGSTQSCTMTVAISDGAGANTSVQYTQGVNPSQHLLTISSGPGGSPNPVASSGQVALNLVAADSLGHSLTYAWSANCPNLPDGTFSPNASAPLPTWNAPANPGPGAEVCAISVSVNDGGFGQTTSASYNQTVSALTHDITFSGPTTSVNPLSSGGTTQLNVTATDTFGHPVTYHWAAVCGALGSSGTFSDANVQNPTWTAPSNSTGTQQTCTLTVTATDNQPSPLSRSASVTQPVNTLVHTLTFSVPPSGTPNPLASGAVANVSATAVDTLSHTITYQWSAACPVALGSNGTFSNATAQSPTWTAPVNTTGSTQSCTISVTASDGQIAPITAQYTQDVNTLTHSLTITQLPAGSVNPSPSSSVVQLSVTAVDTLSHPLTYVWAASCPDLPNNGTFAGGDVSNPTWTAPANLTGSTKACNMTVTVSDGFGSTVIASYTQNVLSLTHTLTISTPPSGSPNAAGSGDVVAMTVGASDTFSHTLNYLWSADCPALPSNGVFSSTTIAAPSWTAPLNETAAVQTCTVTVTVDDGSGGLSQTASYTQSVANASHSLTITTSPTGSPNPVNPTTDAALTVTANDTLGHTLAYAWVAACPGGLGTGTFTPSAAVQSPVWTAPVNSTGSIQNCSMTVTVSDGQGLSQSSSYTQAVSSGIHTLTITAGPNGTPNPVLPSSAVTLSLSANDSFNHALNYAWQATCPGLPNAGSFSPSASVATPTWTAPPNGTSQVKACTIQVTVDDGAGGKTASASYVQNVNTLVHTLSITVQPKGTPDPSGAGQPVALSVTAIDSFAHAVSYLWQATCSEVSGTGTFSPSALAPAPTWTPPANNGQDLNCLIRVTVIDNIDQSATASYIQNVTSAPIHTLTITTPPGGTPNPVASLGVVALNVAAADTLNHSLTFAWSASCPTLGGNGSFSNTSGQNPTWTAPANNTGNAHSCTIGVTVSDGNGLQQAASFTQNITASPHSLTITQQPIGVPNPVATAGSVNLSVAASDSLGHTLGYNWSATCSAGIGSGSFSNAASQTPTWTAPANLTGTTQTCVISVTVNDGANGLTSTASFNESVNSAPHNLTITQQPSGTPNAVASGAVASLSVAANDTLNHTLAYSWSAACGGGIGNGSFVNGTTATPSWTAPVNTTGNAQTCVMSVTVNDGAGGLSQNASYNHVVNAVVHTLTITQQPNGVPNPVASASAVNLSVTAVDTLNHTLAYLWTATCPTLPTAGTFSNATLAAPVWTAPTNHTNNPQSCTLNVTVNDGSGGLSQSASYQQTVSAAPHTMTFTTLPSGTPNPVVQGTTANLSATAVDSIPGHTVGYQWLVTCPGGDNGTLSSATAQNPTWTAPVLTPGSPIVCTVSVTASDGQGLSQTQSYTHNVSAPTSHTLTITQQPAGSPNPAANGQQVALSATITDSFAHPLQYLWQATCAEVSGTGTFSPNASAAAPTWTPPANNSGGDLNCLLRVTAIDTEGLSVQGSFIQRVTLAGPPSDTVTISTQPSGTPNPVPSAGNANLSVAATDSLGHSLTYAWTASCPTLGGNGAFSNAGAQNPTWTAPANNTGSTAACTMSVTANDGLGHSANASYTQNVSAVSHSITFTSAANGSPNPVASGAAVAMGATALDSLGHALNYSWSAACAGSGGNGSFSNGNVQNPTWTAPANTSGSPIVCVVQATANDGAFGASATSSYNQTVNSGVPAHSLSITAGPSGTPNPVASGASANLSVTAVDSLAHVLTYSWLATCPGLATNGSFSGSTASPQWVAPVNTTGAAVTCAISVTVSDTPNGLTQTGSYNHVVNTAPSGGPHTLQITAGPTGSPNPSAPASPVTMQATVVDSQGHPLSYLWQSICETDEDGTFSPSAAAISPTWNPPAYPGSDFSCLIRVTVIDNAGLSADKSFVQRVSSTAGPAHTLTITTSPTGTPNPVLSNGVSTLNVAATDSLSHPVSYQWTASCPTLGGNGTFSNSTVQNPTWTAPVNGTGSQQACSLQVTANDGAFGQSVSATFTQNVSATTHTLTITAGPSGTPNPVAAIGPATFAATVVDSLSHTINYAWSAVCPGLPSGTFSSTTVASPSWTPPTNPGGAAFACVITLNVNDGAGGKTASNTFTQNVSAAGHSITMTVPPSGTPNPVSSSSTANLTATAVDSLGHTITYAWSAACPTLPTNGAFSNTATQSPTWTAPSNTTGSTQTCTIQVSASDGILSPVVASFSQNVLATGAGGHTLTINTPPSGTPNPVASSANVAMSAVAVDSQGHGLQFLWNATCPDGQTDGTFSNNTAISPTWTAPINPTDVNIPCLITLLVVDGVGLSANGQYTQYVQPAPHTLTMSTPPSGNPNPVDSEQQVILSASPVDTLGHTLHYEWSASACTGLPDTGSFVPSATDPSASWYAPVNYTNADKTCTISVTVTDDFGKTVTSNYTQTVKAAPLPITVTATTWTGGVLDPAIAPCPPASCTNLQTPNYAVVLYRADGTTEVDAFDAFSLTSGTDWLASAPFAQGTAAVLKLWRNTTAGFSPYWGTDVGVTLAWRTNAAKTLVGTLNIASIQPGATYTILAFIDLDSDGMDDNWEALHGVTNPTLDPDADLLTNLQEFTNDTDPNDPDTDGDNVNDGPEVTGNYNPKDPTDWTPPALRATVGDGVIYLSWNGPLTGNALLGLTSVKLRVTSGTTRELTLTAAEMKQDRYRLKTLADFTPAGVALANGTSYDISLVITRGSITREPLAADIVSATPNDVASTPAYIPTVFLHGFGGNVGANGTAARTFDDTFDFAATTLGWTFGGRFCVVAGTGPVAVPTTDLSLASSSVRATTNAVLGQVGNNNCPVGVAPDTAAGQFFAVDFGNNFADYGTGVNEGVARQASEVNAVLDTLSSGGIASVAVVGEGTGGLAARRFMIDTPAEAGRIGRLVTLDTPHQGADTSYWCSIVNTPAQNAAVSALGGGFERMIAALAASSACDATPPGGVRDVQATCSGSTVQLGTFLDFLAQSALPGTATYSSITGTWTASPWNASVLPGGGARTNDCAGSAWDGLVPRTSSPLNDSVQTTRIVESDRFHESGSNDVASIFCALNNKCLVVEVTGNVTLSLTGTAGTTSQTVATLPGAAFQSRIEAGQLVQSVVVPFALGGDDYDVTIQPGTGTYTLKSRVGGAAPTTIVSGSSTAATYDVDVP